MTETLNILNRVKLSLVEAESRGVFLKINDHKTDEDYLYIEVIPSRTGVGALDHARTMSAIERELRKDGIDKVFLTPELT